MGRVHNFLVRTKKGGPTTRRKQTDPFLNNQKKKERATTSYRSNRLGAAVKGRKMPIEKKKGKDPLNKTKRGHLETTLSLDKDKSILGKRPQNLDKSTALPTELTTKKGNQNKPPAKQGGFNNPQRLPERNR